jgi:hypothetical protein
MIVDVVQGKLRDVMRILNFDLLYLIGHVIRIMNRVQRIHKSVGAINVGATKGIILLRISTNIYRHYSDEDFYRRKFDLLEDQIAVWADEFRVSKFEVWLQIRDGGQGGNVKSIVDPEKARRYVLNWREEWERTGRTPNIKIRPV